MNWKLVWDFLEWLAKTLKINRKKHCLLIVEDDSNVAFLFSEILRRNHYICDIARTGEEGLAIALEKKPTIAFIDMRLPSMDGWTLSKILLQHLPKCHVVLVLGCQEDLIRIEPGYYIGVIIKSVRFEAILDAIKKTKI